MAGLSFERYDELIRQDLAGRCERGTTSKCDVGDACTKKRRATIAQGQRSRSPQGSSIPPFLTRGRSPHNA